MLDIFHFKEGNSNENVQCKASHECVKIVARFWHATDTLPDMTFFEVSIFLLCINQQRRHTEAK